jgi:hypothetical protein
VEQQYVRRLITSWVHEQVEIDAFLVSFSHCYNRVGVQESRIDVQEIIIEVQGTTGESLLDGILFLNRLLVRIRDTLVFLAMTR